MDGEVHQIDLAAVLPARPWFWSRYLGPFIPNCSDRHVPGVLREAEAFRDAGVDEIIILATSAFFAVKAWSDQLNPPEPCSSWPMAARGSRMTLGRSLI